MEQQIENIIIEIPAIAKRGRGRPFKIKCFKLIWLLISNSVLKDFCNVDRLGCDWINISLCCKLHHHNHQKYHTYILSSLICQLRFADLVILFLLKLGF